MKVVDLIRLANLVEQLLRDAAVRRGVPLCPSAICVLIRLCELGRAPVNVLRVDMIEPNLSYQVRQLVDRGLVATEVDPRDRRMRWLSPTANGQGLARAISDDLSDSLEAAVATWGADLRDLARLLLEDRHADTRERAARG